MTILLYLLFILAGYLLRVIEKSSSESVVFPVTAFIAVFLVIAGVMIYG